MRGQTIVLVCALALAKAGTVPLKAAQNNDGVYADPKQAPAICEATSSDGSLVAHEHCNQFYQCSNGNPIVRSCSGTLHYNPLAGYCDWPENVDCGDRIVPETSDGHDNQNTDEAPVICSSEGSEDLLIAHKSCDKFYKCHEGQAVTYKCPGHLLYNAIEGYCDCADSVVCERESSDENKGDESVEDTGNCNPSEAPTICAAEFSDGVLVAHENCNKFYKCVHGSPVEFKCFGDLLFDPAKGHCEWPDKVDCGDRIIPEKEENNNDNNEDSQDNDSTSRENTDSGSTDNGGTGTCNCNPAEAVNICGSDGSDGSLIAHESCNKYYICTNGQPLVQSCPGKLLYNPYKEYCDWADNVECGDRTISEEDSGEAGNDNGSSENGGTDNGDSENEGTCNCNPAEAASICGGDGSDGSLIAHESCNKYYICSNGQPLVQRCPEKLLYNPYKEYCDWADNVECGDRTICEEDSEEAGNDNSSSENEGTDNGDSENEGSGTCNCNPAEAASICSGDGSDGLLIAHESCNKYYICSNGQPLVQRCPGKLLYNPYKEYCDWADNVECGDRTICEEDSGEAGNDNGSSENGGTDTGDSENEGTCNCNPAEAVSICGGDGSDGSLIAHESCNKYYICANGQPLVQRCPGKLLYNPYKEYCDWAGNVECGDRTICEEDSEEAGHDNGSSENGGTDNGDSENEGTCNCNPAEAESICGGNGSDGSLIAHESCNKYFICSNGQPLVQSCPEKLLYNPYKEYCDWAENVECGDRITPEDCEDNNENVDGNDNGSTDNGGSDSGSSENGGSDTCNCDPGQAENICSSEGSDGVLIAHENCNKFYICYNGHNVVQSCPENLFYNPYKQLCDWAHKVECGERIIPEPKEDCEEENNETAGSGESDKSEPESENSGSGESDNSESENENAGNGESDNSESENENAGSGESDNSESENEGGGTCNCNPGEADNICSSENSNGALIAHENCNKFYACNNGQPLAQSCPCTLLYNPYKEVCDWPENVQCGDRIIPSEDCEDSNNEDSDSDNEDNENDESSNENSNIGDSNGGNCDPSQAVEICAADDSEGEFVAHENCKKFYVCVAGNPMTVSCSGNLLYDPKTEQCDWPENVVCGSRIIPDEDDIDINDSIESSSTENEDSGSSTNEGNGHDDPSQAPEICAAEDSEGVLVAHENCNQYYVCVGGKSVTFNCSGSLMYNPSTEQCDWPEKVNCGNRIIPCDGNTNGENCNCDDEEGTNENDTNDNDSNREDEINTEEESKTDSGESDGNDNSSSNDVNDENNSVSENEGINDSDAEINAYCAASGSEGKLLSHENCNQYYACVESKPVVRNCSGNLLFNSNTGRCDWPQNVDCSRTTPGAVSENNDDDESSREDEINTEEESQSDSGESNGNDNSSSNDVNDENNSVSENEGINDSDAEINAYCAASGSEGKLLPHQNCNQYYACLENKPVVRSCSGNLLFNSKTGRCDWPQNVDCSRITPGAVSENNDDDESSREDEISTEQESQTDNGESDGNDNSSSNDVNDENNSVSENDGINDSDAEINAYCAASGSEGKLLPHENCNQYYACVENKPVVRSCSGNLLFNSKTGRCDWPQNVDCSRITPGAVSENNDDDESSREDEISTEEESQADSGESNGNDNNSSNDVNDENSSVSENEEINDSDAEINAYCAASGSEGKLLPHENCNQYYACVENKPVVRSCSGNLLFNSKTGRCDWPQNVDCSRVTPGAVSENNDDDKNTEAVEEEADTADVADSFWYEAAVKQCLLDGSSGRMVPHEDCNQYYDCVENKPIVRSCSGSLLFNSQTGRCDWPQNVDCSRITPGSVSENKDDGVNGSEDADSANVAGSFGYEAAVKQCLLDGSSGRLVPHENCNKFYACLQSQPFEFQCTSDYLFDMDRQSCYWPDQVECGERKRQ